MTDFIVDHAISTVYCTPSQDNQVILKPARITPKGGVSNSWKVLYTSVYLPVKHARFHLYQIGQVHPYVMSLFPKVDMWTTLAESCMSNNTICDIYTSKGIELPRCETWYIVTEEKNILIAVKENKKIPFDFNADEIFFRVYNNEYFSSTRSTALTDHIHIEGGTITLYDSIMPLRDSYLAKSDLPGSVYVLKNGYKIHDLSYATVGVGDVVEFVYDSSILKVLDFPINSLDTFDSTLDSKGKYLLHQTGGVGNTIEYQDDIDMFLIDSVTGVGVYMHKNSVDALRMVTHRDYSVPVALVSAFLNSHLGKINPQNATIRLHVRKSGYLRPLVNEHHRVKELYKLPDTLIKRAMIGMDSTVPVWTADSLEMSKYITIMQSNPVQITNALVSEAYGYNAIAKMGGDTPVKAVLFNSQRIAVVPYLMQTGCCAFEYDVDGYLLGSYAHAAGDIYHCINLTCRYVEMTLGAKSTAMDDHFNVASLTLDPKYDYRFYSTPKDEHVLDKVWTDVTGSGEIAVIGNTATWLNGATHDTVIRSNKQTLVRTINILPNDGLMGFYLAGEVNSVETALRIPMGELQVWLNGKSLIEGLDYHVHFPKVIIVNKEYLINPYVTPQVVTYRCTGVCYSDLSRTDISEFGFIRNNRLSADHRYNIRDDKVIKITVAGGVRTRDDLQFNEDTVSYELTHPLNGKPYQVKDSVVSVKQVTPGDTLTLRQISRTVDKQIADYLTLKMEDNTPDVLNPIESYYKVYSPFFCKIMFDMLTGNIDNSLFSVHYNDDQIRNIVEPYVYLLDYDPINPDYAVDDQYVIIHPHHLSEVVNLNIYQYTFMNRLINLYSAGKVNFSTHARIV